MQAQGAGAQGPLAAGSREECSPPCDCCAAGGAQSPWEGLPTPAAWRDGHGTHVLRLLHPHVQLLVQNQGEHQEGPCKPPPGLQGARSPQRKHHGEEPTQVAVGRRGPAWLRQDLRDPGRRRQPRCAVTRLEEASRGRHCSSWDQKLAPGRVPGRAAFTGTAPRPAPCCARPGVPLHVSTHPTLDTSRERGPPLGTAREGRGGGGNARCPLAGAGKGGMPTPTGALFWEPN